jgi:putative effector of murein hydrolase LrgA (UPF0299 family)
MNLEPINLLLLIIALPGAIYGVVLLLLALVLHLCISTARRDWE